MDHRQELPRNVKPLHYKLTIEPDFESFTFNGNAEIDLAILEDSHCIALNSKEIAVQCTKIESEESTLTSALEVTHDAENERITIVCGQQTLKAGQGAKIHLSFNGNLDDGLAGFYRASWKSQDGVQHWLAVTQLSPTDARKAFPCFDEPALKAEFTVTLIADHEMTCLSNMDIASQVDIDS